MRFEKRSPSKLSTTAEAREQRLAEERERDFERDQSPEVARVAAPPRAADHGVDDELPDPEHGDGDERAHEAERDHRGGEPPVRLPHEADERRDVAQDREPLAQGRRLGGRPDVFSLGIRRVLRGAPQQVRPSDRLPGGQRARQVVLGDALARGLAQAAAEFSVARQPAQGLGQRRRVVDGNDQPRHAVLHQLQRPRRAVAHDHGEPAAHRFEQRVGRPLDARGQREDRRRAVEDIRVAHDAVPLDAPLKPKARGAHAQVSFEPPVADERQPPRSELVAELREGFEQNVVRLVRDHAADVEDEGHSRLGGVAVAAVRECERVGDEGQLPRVHVLAHVAQRAARVRRHEVRAVVEPARHHVPLLVAREPLRVVALGDDEPPPHPRAGPQRDDVDGRAQRHDQGRLDAPERAAQEDGLEGVDEGVVIPVEAFVGDAVEGGGEAAEQPPAGRPPAVQPGHDPSQQVGHAVQPGAVYDDVVDGRVEFVEPAPVVQGDDADPAPAPAPFVGECGDDPLDAARVKAVADEYQVGRKVHTHRHKDSLNKSPYSLGKFSQLHKTRR